eukprot:1142083-Pelagomonas_calceolata.AAC.3
MSASARDADAKIRSTGVSHLHLCTTDSGTFCALYTALLWIKVCAFITKVRICPICWKSAIQLIIESAGP